MFFSKRETEDMVLLLDERVIVNSMMHLFFYVEYLGGGNLMFYTLSIRLLKD